MGAALLRLGEVHVKYLFLLSAFAATISLSAATMGGYSQTNLVSDIPGFAAQTDPNLINPWGISESGSSPFWVSDNGSGLATLYSTFGAPQSLVVTIPGVGGKTSTPTGQVFNATTNFNSDLFIFASEDGNISGWRGALGTTAQTLFSSSDGAVFKGLAIATIAQGTYLYAADFHNDQITVIPGTGAPALTGNFVDPTLPAGFAPFNIQNLNGQLYVTYARQDAARHDDVPGAGNGFVDVFDLTGKFVQRLISNGPLDSPWGLAIAPAGFGGAAGDLLVGNFGDGSINAFSLTGTFIGTLGTAPNAPLINDGLWALTFGNGGNGGNPNTLYLTAGLNNEADGLFAQINAVPEPATLSLFALGAGLLAWKRRVWGRLLTGLLTGC
jgi:uncharacterized protein (TIGR03118 family)